MTADEFIANVEAARENNPKCKACGRDLTAAALTEVIYLRHSKRLICVDCPEAITVEFKKGEVGHLTTLI